MAIKSNYTDKLSERDISKEYNPARFSTKAVSKEYNISKAYAEEYVSKTREMLADAYKTHTAKEVAEMYGISEGAVRYAAKKAGVKKDPTLTRFKKKSIKQEEQDWLSWYNQGAEVKTTKPVSYSNQTAQEKSIACTPSAQIQKNTLENITSKTKQLIAASEVNQRANNLINLVYAKPADYTLLKQSPKTSSEEIRTSSEQEVQKNQTAPFPSWQQSTDSKNGKSTVTIKIIEVQPYQAADQTRPLLLLNPRQKRPDSPVQAKEPISEKEIETAERMYESSLNQIKRVKYSLDGTKEERILNIAELNRLPRENVEQAYIQRAYTLILPIEAYFAERGWKNPPKSESRRRTRNQEDNKESSTYENIYTPFQRWFFDISGQEQKRIRTIQILEDCGSKEAVKNLYERKADFDVNDSEYTTLVSNINTRHLPSAKKLWKIKGWDTNLPKNSFLNRTLRKIKHKFKKLITYGTTIESMPAEKVAA